MNDPNYQRYAETRSEAAFTELVQRHIDLVYSAACVRSAAMPIWRRMLRKPSLWIRPQSALFHHAQRSAGCHIPALASCGKKDPLNNGGRHVSRGLFYEDPLRETRPNPLGSNPSGSDGAMDELAESERDAVLFCLP
jgi:hypothetical protein